MARKSRFEKLPPEAVAYLREAGTELGFADGERIVSRGDPGEAFFVVLAGRVEVRITADGDCQLPLVSLEEGSFFGEMSILTGEPVSADVVALEAVTVLRYPGDLFSKALSESEPLRTHIMGGMAANLQRTTRDAWNFFQRAEALNVLMDSSAHGGPLVTESRKMSRIAGQVESLAGGIEPVLVGGEAGTGKTFVASRIHRLGAGEHRPFIVVDCRSLAGEEAVPFLFGSSWSQGESDDSSGFGVIQSYGALHLANRGTLVLRHVETLDGKVQELLARYARNLLEGRTDYPRTKLVATSSENPAAPPEKRALHPDLAGVLESGTIALPPLRKRRKDIIPLARLFLEEHCGQEKSFTQSAEHTLLSRQFSHRNVAELKEAVELASLFAEGRNIEGEHIFTGPKDQGGTLEYDLRQLPLVRRLTSDPFLRVARTFVFASFAAIIFFSLFASQSRAGRAANSVTWSLWEPLLLVFFLFVGRVWCTVCPLSTMGRIAARVKSFGRQPGDWLKKYTGWIVIASFIAVIWSEHTFHMIARPRAAGFLLLALMAGAVVFSVIYRRETWCRYVCPLGNLGAVYALPAVLNVRSNPSVCATYCTTHECYKGTGDRSGCPVFHHPLYARDSHHCKQCYTCLDICPHNSARLYLRPPLQSIWGQGDVGNALLPFALFLFLFSPIMLASQGASWASTVGGFTANTLAAVAGTLVFLPRLPRLITPEPHPDPAFSSRVAFALLILAWGPAMAYQLGHISGLEQLRVHGAEGTFAGSLLPPGGLTVQTLLQAGVIVMAALFAGICLAGIKWRFSRSDGEISPWGWRTLFLLCALYTLASLTLVLKESLLFG
jgi:DNA-binding NtrC family response regulator